MPHSEAAECLQEVPALIRKSSAVLAMFGVGILLRTERTAVAIDSCNKNHNRLILNDQVFAPLPFSSSVRCCIFNFCISQ